MDQHVEFQWLQDERNLKEALKTTLGCSGQLIKKHFSSKEEDRAVRAKDITNLPLDFVNHLNINPLFVGPSPKLIKETNQYLALHKPANLHCHPHNYYDCDTVLNFLVQEKKWDALNINKAQYDRGLLYRLDFETSGILLAAKTQDLFEKTRNSFQVEMKRKFYWAIVSGSFNQEGNWTHYFRAIGIKGAKQKVSFSPQSEAKEGTLSVKKVFEQKGKSLLLINLQTGLRHQIRAQLACLGFPILGDQLYGGEVSNRLYLHALRYEWFEILEDSQADLFESFFDLDRALKMSHDMIGRF